MRARNSSVLIAFLMLDATAFCEGQSTAKSPLRPADLVGEYSIIAEEKAGEKESERRFQAETVRFTQDRIVVADPEKKEIYGAIYTLDSGKTPCRIKMTSLRVETEGQVA